MEKVKEMPPALSLTPQWQNQYVLNEVCGFFFPFADLSAYENTISFNHLIKTEHGALMNK